MARPSKPAKCSSFDRVYPMNAFNLLAQPTVELAWGVDGEIVRLSDTMRKRLEAAQVDTVASLASLRSAIDAVTRAAEEQVRETHCALDGLSGESSEGSIARAVAHLEAVVANYVEIVAEETDNQRLLATRAAGRCDEIMVALHEIDRVAFTAKLLSLNAIIKAETVTHGGAMSVIAMSMASLTAKLSGLNQEVTILGRALVNALPLIAMHARATREQTLEFMAGFRAAVGAIGPRVIAVRQHRRLTTWSWSVRHLAVELRASAMMTFRGADRRRQLDRLGVGHLLVGRPRSRHREQRLRHGRSPRAFCPETSTRARPRMHRATALANTRARSRTACAPVCDEWRISCPTAYRDDA